MHAEVLQGFFSSCYWAEIKQFFGLFYYTQAVYLGLYNSAVNLCKGWIITVSEYWDMAILSYVPTAVQIYLTAPITQIPQPSSTDHDLHDLLLTKSTHVWSSNDRLLVE